MNRIALVGISPVAAAQGMALKKASPTGVEIVGTSGDRNILSAALKKGAIDVGQNNLKSAVANAQIVIVNAPLHETHELMETIGPLLPDECVVTDTSISKRLVIGWADRYLPKSVSFVAGRPLIKIPPQTIAEADPSIFDDTNYCVVPSESSKQAAVKVLVDLIEQIGAKPLFLDADEHDSYTSAMVNLPTVLSAAYVTATAGDESWRDIHRLAAAEFGAMSRFVSNDPEDNEANCLANPETLVHWIDQIITELYTFRNHIRDSDQIDDDLLEKFIKAWEARGRWESGNVITERRTELPSVSENMASFFVGKRLTDRMRHLTDDSDKEKRLGNYRRKR